MHVKRWIAWLLALVITVIAGSTYTLAESEELVVSSGCHSIDAARGLQTGAEAEKTAQAIVAYETQSQTLLYSYHPDEPIYPASLVKLMTALLVLEYGKTTDIVMVQQSTLDSVSENAISADLQAGETLTVEQLLYCMLVGSANDAAAVLAEHISGSQAAFVILMNQTAQKLGCSATEYVNVHGLHEDTQLTTARDTCKILTEALKHEQFREIFNTVYYNVPATNLHDERKLATNNFLAQTGSIHYDSRVTGGRTGTTTDGYRNVASLSQCGNMEIVCVVLQAQSVYAEDGYSIQSYGGFPETTEILDMVSNGYSRQQVIFENEILQQRTVSNGECNLFIAAREGCSTVLPTDVTTEQLSFRYVDVPGSGDAPIEKGQNVASLQVWYNDLCLTQTDVYAMNKVRVAEIKTAAEDEQNSQGQLPLGWILATAAVCAALFIGVSYFRNFNSRGRKHRGSRSRRAGVRS